MRENGRKKSVFYVQTTKRFGYFAEETTLHGFPEIHNSTNQRARTFWTIILLISIAAVAYEIYKVIGDYLERPIITIYDWKSVNTFEFPQVEICSDNMINFTRLKELRLHPHIAGLAKMAMPDSIALPMFERAIDRKFGDLFNYPVFSKVVTQPTKAAARQQLQEVLQEVKPEASSGPAFDIIFAVIQAELMTLFPNETTDINTDYFALHYTSVKKLLDDNGDLDLEAFYDLAGFELDKVLMACEFLGELMNCSEIASPIFDPRYGRCFIIDVNRSQTIGGLGLLTIINTNSAFGIPDLPNFLDGIQVRINKEINLASLDVLRVPTGTAASIGLKPTYYNLEVSESYGRCVSDMDRLAITYPYSDTVCRVDCFVHHTMDACNCSLVIPKAYIKEGAKYRACMTHTEVLCLSRYLQKSRVNDRNANECMKKCRPSCEYWNYSPTVTYNNFPSKALHRRLLETKAFGLGIADFDAKKYALGANGEFSLEDLIVMEISFTELSYLDISQQVALSFDGFISQIGGIFGLFLGASLISFVQIASFLTVKCCCPLLKTAKRRLSHPNHVDTEKTSRAENSQTTCSKV